MFLDIIKKIEPLINRGSISLSKGLENTSIGKDAYDYKYECIIHLNGVYERIVNENMEEEKRIPYMINSAKNYYRLTYKKGKSKSLDIVYIDDSNSFKIGCDDKNILYCEKENSSVKNSIMKIMKYTENMKGEDVLSIIKIIKTITNPSSEFINMIKNGIGLIRSLSRIMNIKESKIKRLIHDARSAINGSIGSKESQRFYKLCCGVEQDIRDNNLIYEEKKAMSKKSEKKKTTSDPYHDVELYLIGEKEEKDLNKEAKKIRDEIEKETENIIDGKKEIDDIKDEKIRNLVIMMSKEDDEEEEDEEEADEEVLELQNDEVDDEEVDDEEVDEEEAAEEEEADEEEENEEVEEEEAEEDEEVDEEDEEVEENEAVEEEEEAGEEEEEEEVDEDSFMKFLNNEEKKINNKIKESKKGKTEKKEKQDKGDKKRSPRKDSGEMDNYKLFQGQIFKDIKDETPDSRRDKGINPWNMNRLEGYVWEYLDESNGNQEETLERLEKISKEKGFTANPEKRLRTLYPHWKKWSNVAKKLEFKRKSRKKSEETEPKKETKKESRKKADKKQK